MPDRSVFALAFDSALRHPVLRAALADHATEVSQVEQELADEVDSAADEIRSAAAAELEALVDAEQALARAERAATEVVQPPGSSIMTETITRLREQVAEFEVEQDRLVREIADERARVEAYRSETEVLQARESVGMGRSGENSADAPPPSGGLRGRVTRRKAPDQWEQRADEYRRRVEGFRTLQSECANVVVAKKRLALQLQKLERQEEQRALRDPRAAELQLAETRLEDARESAVQAVARAIVSHCVASVQRSSAREPDEPVAALERPDGTGHEPAAGADQAGEQAPIAAVLWAHADPGWTVEEAQAWERTVLGFTHLLRACGIDARLDLFYGHVATDWARFGPRLIREADFVLVAVSPTWRRAWEGDVGPGSSAGALAEANTLRGIFSENQAEFLRRVIPVLLPGRDRNDLPTELAATSDWEPVPALDEVGIENLLRRVTGQPAYPTPPLGARRALPARVPPPAVPTQAGERAAIARDADPETQILVQLDRAESALAGMPAASDGAGLEPWDQARASVDARREALRAELAKLDAAGAPPADTTDDA